MVKIERPEASTWKFIAVEREQEEVVELRLVSGAGPTGDKFQKLTVGGARCVACLLLAAAEHPTEGRLDFEGDAKSLFVKRAGPDYVELRLWERGPYTELDLPTTRRIAHGLLAESQ